MQKFIACLLLVASLGIISPLLSAQQNQTAQKSDAEIEALKKRVSEIEKQLQSVDNVEKMDLQAKLAEANTKLINAEFGKFERGLKDSNDERMGNWVIILLAFLSVVGVGVWSWLKNRTNQLIETEVGKNIKGFKEAVKAQDVIKNQLGMLEKQSVASVLEGVIDYDLLDKNHHPGHIKALREEALLQVFDDNETYYPILIYKAAEVLAARKSPRLICPLLYRLNLAADSDIDVRYFINVPPLARLPKWHDAVKFLEYMHTPEAYEGLNRFLNYLLTDNPKSKNWFLREAVSSLVQVGIKLNMGDSVPILKRALLDIDNPGHEVLSKLVEYFDRFNEPAEIKEILINYLDNETANMTLPEKQLADQCLQLVRKHDPDFAENWRASKTTDNSEA